MTIQLRSSTEAGPSQPWRTNAALSGRLGPKAPDTGRGLPGEGCWQSQEPCQTLSWSRTLEHCCFWLIKAQKSNYLHSFSENSYKAGMWNDLKAALRCRIINLHQHHLSFPLQEHCTEGWLPISYQDGAGSKGRSIFNQLNPSLVWASQSLQRTPHSCSHKANEIPYRRCWKWSAERQAPTQECAGCFNH